MKNRIKKIRTDKGYSQQAFADELKISRSAVCKLESGENNPSEQTVELLCKNFKVNREWLLHDKGDPYKSKKGAFSELLSDLEDTDDEFIKDLLSVYMNLDESSKVALRKLAAGMAEKRKRQD